LQFVRVETDETAPNLVGRFPLSLFIIILWGGFGAVFFSNNTEQLSAERCAAHSLEYNAKSRIPNDFSLGRFGAVWGGFFRPTLF
jgi:hypothetical protein